MLLSLSTFAASGWLFDYVLILQYETPAAFFLFDRQFLLQWLDHPGGFLIYGGRFLRQFYHCEWLGALVVSSLITWQGILLCLIRMRLGHGISIFHTLAPCLALLALHSASTLTVGLLVSSGAFLGYVSLPRTAPRQVYALLATPALYLVAGGYSWFFVLWVVSSEWLDRPLSAGLAYKLLYPVLTICVPFVAYRWVFPISLRSAWLSPASVPQAFLDGAFHAYVLMVPVWPRIWWGSRLESCCRSPRGLAAQALLLIILAGLLVWQSFDADTKQWADYHRLYRQGQWQGILEKAERDPLPAGTDQLAEHPAFCMRQFFVNYALCQEGRLLDEMFRYPQAWGTRGLILNYPADYAHRAIYNSDLYFAAGHMNAAYRLAYNHVVDTGRTYGNLRRMAECNMVNGSYEIAEKYLNILERTLFQRQFAELHLRMIADTDAADRYFAEHRRRLPTVELDVDLGEFAALLSLVRSNPHNRMAFDCLTAWCLLDKTLLPMVAGNVAGFRQAGYRSIPAHCQEALMVWEGTTGSAVDRQVVAYDRRTAWRFRQFWERSLQHRDTNSARLGLSAAFGDTYMYYYALAHPPMEGTPPLSWLRLSNEFYSQGKMSEAMICRQQAMLKHPEATGEAVELRPARPGATPDTSRAGQSLGRPRGGH